VELQKLADETGLTIKVRHYPPGTSPMVLRASPVTLDTAATPPHPAARASLAATIDDRVRPVSNRPLPNVAESPADRSCKRWYRAAPHQRYRPPPSQKVAWPHGCLTANPDSLIVVAVLTTISFYKSECKGAAC